MAESMGNDENLNEDEHLHDNVNIDERLDENVILIVHWEYGNEGENENVNENGNEIEDEQLEYDLYDREIGKRICLKTIKIKKRLSLEWR